MENLRGGFISDFNGRGTIFENFYFLSFFGSGRYSIGSGSKFHAKVGHRRVRSSYGDPVWHNRGVLGESGWQAGESGWPQLGESGWPAGSPLSLRY